MMKLQTLKEEGDDVKNLLLLPLLVILSSCGLARMEEVKEMSQREVGYMDDELFCYEARRFLILRHRVPVAIIKEAQRRGLEYCINPDQTGYR